MRACIHNRTLASLLLPLECPLAQKLVSQSLLVGTKSVLWLLNGASPMACHHYSTTLLLLLLQVLLLLLLQVLLLLLLLLPAPHTTTGVSW
jgi:hypothetical protein